MNKISRRITDEVTIVLCGEAGQGIKTVESILIRMFKLSGYHVFSSKELMSRIRGGSNSTTIRVSSKRVCAPVDRIDILIPLSDGAIDHVKKRISKETMIFTDTGNIKTKHPHTDIPFTKTAEEIGSKIYANVVAVGVLSALLHVDTNLIKRHLKQWFQNKDKKVIENNVHAAEQGYEIGEQMNEKDIIRIAIDPEKTVKEEVLLSGTDAIGLGALSGGCNFISSYPMTPATGVLTFLARHGPTCSVIAEQGEDEISAINMAIGAWYAGALAMVSTSGGGLDLMSEGLSLAADQETPMVIHLGQRPGPATGLPTRTEQADLNLALYAGHGEYPRIIFAPGTIEQGIELTNRAFDMADKYQVPVFLLTDQYYVDSYCNVPSIDIHELHSKKHYMRTTKKYQRYKLTKDGISPRGIPGYGTGIVCTDCHMHSEDGHISEDLDQRDRMVEKFMDKARIIEKNTLAPTLIGQKNYAALVVCWGSNYHVVKEALERIGNSAIAALHFQQVYPLHTDTLKYLKKAKIVMIIENNAQSQFAMLIKQHTGFSLENKILKYNGLPFTVEEVVDKIAGWCNR